MATLEKMLDPKLSEGNKKAKDSQVMINKMMATLQKEKAYNPKVVTAATWEFLEHLDGQTPLDRLVSFSSATERKENIRRLCLKSFLLTIFESCELPESVSPERWARIIFMAAGVRAKDGPKEETIRYLKRVCGVIGEFLKSENFTPEEVEQGLVRSTTFAWSINELNKRSSLPSKNEFEEKLKNAVEEVSLSRKQPIDLFHILEIFGSAPHKFIQTIPVLMRPQLERMHHPQVMGCLKKVLVFITDNLEWDFENMPTTVATIQKHPGVPMAAEVAKCVSFGELYDVLIRVLTELVLGKDRGFDKCETKLKERVGPDGELPSLLSVREFRDLFGLPPEAYDKYGEPLTAVSEKSRAHSYIASVVLVPFLQGLYEARGNYFNLELAVDHLFKSRAEEVKKARETTRSLDDKRSLRKALVVLRKAHTTLVSALETCASDSKKNLKEILAPQMAVYDSVGLEPQAILNTAINDLSRLKKNPKSRIVEARHLLEMAKEAPEGTEGLPPSPWAAFFGQNLKTISKVLKAAGAAVINLDTISNLISDHLVKTLASNLPIDAASKKTMTQMSEFKTVVQVSWENARGRLPLDVNNRLVDLLREVHTYTRAKPKAKHPDVLCRKLLGLTRPFVQEYFRCLYEVDGQDLYTTIVSLTEEDQGKMEQTKSKAQLLQEEQLERATSHSRHPDLEL